MTVDIVSKCSLLSMPSLMWYCPCKSFRLRHLRPWLLSLDQERTMLRAQASLQIPAAPRSQAEARYWWRVFLCLPSSGNMSDQADPRLSADRVIRHGQEQCVTHDVACCVLL